MPQYPFPGTADLFSDTPTPALLILPELLTLDQANELLSKCDDLPFEQHYVAGKYPMPREILWFGDIPYSYSGTTHPAKAMPDWLIEVKHRLEAHASQELGRTIAFNSVLLNRYRNQSDSVGWHADDEAELGTHPVIASISLGATREFSFRLKSTPSITHHVPLTHGTCVVMHDDCQLKWDHAVLKTSQPCGARINLTFRLTMLTP